MAEDTGELILTYPELGERLGITPDSARLKAKRKADRGEWTLLPPNKDGGQVRVRVLASDLPEHPPERIPRGPERQGSDTPSTAELHAELVELRASVAELRDLHARAAGERERTERASTEVAEAKLQAAV